MRGSNVYSTCSKIKLKFTNDDIILSKIHHIHSTCLQARQSKELPMILCKCAYDIISYKNPPNLQPSLHLIEMIWNTRLLAIIPAKKILVICIDVSQNINCLGVSTINKKSQQEKAINWLIQHEVDIIGWQESGIAFHLLPHSKRLAFITRSTMDEATHNFHQW